MEDNTVVLGVAGGRRKKEITQDTTRVVVSVLHKEGKGGEGEVCGYTTNILAYFSFTFSCHPFLRTTFLHLIQYSPPHFTLYFTLQSS